MRILQINEALAEPLASGFASFERAFTYPLGGSRRFTICHSNDPSRFFRALGEGLSFLALDGERVVGCISGSIRTLLSPDNIEEKVLYVGDLKVATDVRVGRVLILLAQALFDWASPKTKMAFAIVMEGSNALPERYTGRLGIPRFDYQSEVSILRFDIWSIETVSGRTFKQTKGLAINQPSWRTPLGNVGLRSVDAPVQIHNSEGNASALLEDTELAKQLVDIESGPMRSAHLSAIDISSLSELGELCQKAIFVAHTQNKQHLFLSLPLRLSGPFLQSWRGPQPLVASARVYTHNINHQADWWVNTAEI
ncbi:MAG: hypothetical protein KDB07_05220 [Planctomycetes bacterium]|nr:hypothetical protein [Planctomycetota bacterium]